MAAAAPVIAIVASVVGAGAALRGGREEEKGSEAAAQEALARSRQEAKDTEKRHRRVLASQRAKYGAAGVTMEGTPLLVQMESMRESEEELSRIVEKGEAEAREYRRGGRAAAASGRIEAVGELAGGATLLTKMGREFDWW